MKYLSLLFLIFVFTNNSFAGDCMATTLCNSYYGPYQISCEVWNNGPSACTWNVIPGRMVRCTGVSARGMWENFVFYCN